MKKILAIAVCLLLPAAIASAAVAPDIKCQQSKIKARASLAKCLAKKASLVIAGEPDESAVCRSKFRTRIVKADAKATKAGTSCRFLDNGDDTVSDLDTGLTWEAKEGSDLTTEVYPSGFFTLQTWSGISPTSRDGIASLMLTFLNGGNASEGTSPSTCRGGQCDWRMPTLGELEGLLDTHYFEPAVSPGLSNTQPNFHLSATEFRGSPYLSWQLNMRDGSLLLARKSYFSTMRAVRAAF